jgi:signal transduction histidine kinase
VNNLLTPIRQGSTRLIGEESIHIELIERAQIDQLENFKTYLDFCKQMICDVNYIERKSFHEIDEEIEALEDYFEDCGIEGTDRLCRIMAYFGYGIAEAKRLSAFFKECDSFYIDYLYKTGQRLVNFKDTEKNTESIASLIAGMKDYSRVDRDKLIKINVRSDIEQTLTLLKHELKDINIEYDFNEIPSIVTSQDINHVWTNIILNAIQSMGYKGKLTIMAEHGDEFVTTKFCDQGPGISKENLNKIFDPFYTTKDVGQGTGLGLSICYNIVKAHGGEISAESTFGEGTTISVKLPFKYDL